MIYGILTQSNQKKVMDISAAILRLVYDRLHPFFFFRANWNLNKKNLWNFSFLLFTGV